jgi:hypothetical protein
MMKFSLRRSFDSKNAVDNAPEIEVLSDEAGHSHAGEQNSM